ncbi:uncharacterized protein LOC124305018 isoform X1 [Neodiprion virginianus]|uniref:uncharacterized protein LOC124305018 isoform X1 n=1 Tax=Neodiprion virginianus TaxID=2961670 RepID=UPI001EE77F52|nr:uncharacterized protein LOC124305018 isoform X1 [Neodiprion virginianus]XP_046619917.1 uncharacterized protein LOC124305018 isoform X1 [Neodiprion virginianus]XP_046619918.1 uncharacterized protein LOC124305018 isoform X1 [Neodiprion virginianus]
MSAGPSICHILDFPNEILMKIIFHLNARERVPLGNSCKKLHSLIFEEKELLRNLDFSKDGRLTSVSDIRQYFDNSKASRYIQRVNLRNVNFIEPEQMLNDYIGNAVNIVDLNISGTRFEDVQGLGYFLKLLPHVKRLSIDWPRRMEDNAGPCCKVLRGPLSKLTYLSIQIWHPPHTKKFVRYLQMCQQLKELRMIGRKSCYVPATDEFPCLGQKQLRSLEIIEFCGPCCGPEKRFFMTLLPELEKWTDFHVPKYYIQNGFYFEKNVPFAKKLCKTNWMNPRNIYFGSYFEFGQSVLTERLLTEVIKVTHKDPPKCYCCLSLLHQTDICVIKIEEAKRLLKDPSYELSYLRINHNIKTNCDAHLVVSAFPKLTELILSNITKVSGFVHSRKQLKRKYNKAVKQEGYLTNKNLDSSFSMIVQNSPHLKHLTLDTNNSTIEYEEMWDLNALHLISGWTNLRTLRLSSVPIEDGIFLTEIGRACKHLEILDLYDLGPGDVCCYIDELCQMIADLKNLREFRIHQDNIGEVSRIFVSLANNVQLRKVDVISDGENTTTNNLIPSIEHLLQTCSKLTTFQCIIDEISEADSVKLSTMLRSFKCKPGKLDFQFQVVWSMDLIMDDSEWMMKEDVITEDARLVNFPCDMSMPHHP